MAKINEVQESLTNTIKALSDAIGDPTRLSDSAVKAYSEAAKNFAEARAWTMAVGQSH